MDYETRNAFRLIKRASKLCGDKVTGDLYHLPVTIHHGQDTDVDPVVLNSHFAVVDYALEVLMQLGFSFEGALDVVENDKTTNFLVKDLYAKV